MKIIQLTAENVKKLTVVQITPANDLVQITGKNGQGKTSVLDCIWWALSGKESVQSVPIRKGQESARIELLLGTGKTVELIVERRFTAAASYLTVKTPEGAKYPSPQKLLEDMLGALTFDPLDFMRRDARGQFDVLRRLVNLNIDLDALKMADAADREARTVINRDAKTKAAQATAYKIADDLPATRIDDARLLNELTAAVGHNTAVERAKNKRASDLLDVQRAREAADKGDAGTETSVVEIELRCTGDVQALQDQIKALEERIKTVKLKAQTDIIHTRSLRAREAADLRAQADKLEQALNAEPVGAELIDVEALRERIRHAQSVNLEIEKRDRKDAILAEVAELEKRSETLTARMTERSDQRSAALTAAAMPVPGLSFGDGTVLYNELPLEQASDAEQLMISTAIAAALNPKLRVLRIRDGSLLDDDAMKRLADFAAERDFQVWIERVDGSGVVGIVMEDGHVKGEEQQQAAE